MEPLRGRLLVATPELTDPNFSRTVVLICDHGEEGAFGIVLNRATDRLLADVLEPWAAVASAPGVVFRGGPVCSDQAIGLGCSTAQEAGLSWAPLFGDLELADPARADLGRAGLASVGLDDGPDGLALLHFRLFTGYAGWGRDQLEAEIETGSWFVVDADPTTDLFGADPDRLWSDVLRRQPGRTAWFANCPEDRSTN